ncbi:MAG: hypothetical protein GYA42_05445, partial [Syntrophomonadaceae bacterium]|nr:hypothetical protein [Syntrophomonadaceae bacterium]
MMAGLSRPRRVCRHQGRTHLQLAVAGLLMFAILWLPLAVLAAYKVPNPPPDLYVLDQAGVMNPDTEKMILSTSQELARRTKAQVAVVTLKSLDGYPIEDVSL